MQDDPSNQPSLRGDIDLWSSDSVVQDYANHAGADPNALARFGATLGQVEMREHGRLANRFSPELVLYDRGGRRLDQVNFHPSYHALMEHGIGAGYSSVAWGEAERGHSTHAGMVYLQSQIEPGVACPMTMSYAAFPALSGVSDPLWRSRLLSCKYDPRPLPISEKSGVTLGMAMTEKQGGSDVRRNETRAEPDGNGYRLFGHKWFCSAPMSDGFLTLAQAPGGLTCFLVPRRFPDGSSNAIHLLRLKEKLGNQANASAEIEYHGAWAERLGDEGAGVRQILQMVHHTRLDTAIAPAGLMRAALSEAIYWCKNRVVFQKVLVDQPLMQAVLADLALDWEAATALAFRVAESFDTGDAGFARIGVALAKFHNNKLCPNVVYEAMECLGGMGYTDDTPLPMLFREAPLNSIWEGSGNVICLDILRTLERDKAAVEGLQSELAAGQGAHAGYDEALRQHAVRWPSIAAESEARWYAERTAVLLAGSILLRRAPSAVAEAYIKTRVMEDRGRIYGSVSGMETRAILARITP